MIKKEAIVIKDLSSWDIALKESVKILENLEATDHTYLDSIYESIEKYGPYINLGKGVCMPHARIPNVRKNEMGLLKLKKRVFYNDSDKEGVMLFFPFCTKDSNTHIDMIKSLSKILADDSKLQSIMEATSEDEIFEIINGGK